MELKSLSIANLEETLELVTSVLHNTALYCLLEPEAKSRTELLRRIFAFRLRFALERAEVRGAVEKSTLLGFAVWTPPFVSLTKEAATQYGSSDAASCMSNGQRERYLSLLGIIDEAIRKHVQQPFWGLAPLVIYPEHQTKGIASLLMRDQLLKIDLEGLPCFLNTQEEKSVAMYRRYNFSLVGQNPILGSTISNYSMIRQPVSL